MLTQTLAVDQPLRPAARSWLTVPAVAGAAYTVAWAAGLGVSSASTDVNSTGAQVVAAYAGHEGAVVTQFALTEGVASLCLAVVAVALGRVGIRAGAASLGRVIAATGLAAAGIALVQSVLGIALAVSVVPAGHAGTAGTLNDTINRLDGLKMFVLAALAVAGTVLARRTHVLPKWLVWVGALLAVAIAASGVGYALINNALSVAAWVSLPLLLVFITGAGVVLGRAAQR